MVGVPRIVRAFGIPFPLGSPFFSKDVEKQIRLAVFRRAVDALGYPATGQPVIFWPQIGNSVDNYMGPVKDYAGQIPAK